MGIAELEQTTALRILVHLLKARKASRTRLRENIDASVSAIYNALPKLKRLKLIHEESKETFPFTVEVSLTEKGRKVAEHLEKIKAILAEWILKAGELGFAVSSEAVQNIEKRYAQTWTGRFFPQLLAEVGAR